MNVGDLAVDLSRGPSCGASLYTRQPNGSDTSMPLITASLPCADHLPGLERVGHDAETIRPGPPFWASM